jgi:RimJ/RimL family protein N-acetyltransferase
VTSGPPIEWECDVALDDGEPVHLRPLRRDDAPRLRRLYDRLSTESLYYRFFSPVPPPSDRQLRALTELDYDDRMALVAMIDDEVVGVARYDRDGEARTDAEIALIVQDDQQGRGIGTCLLTRLAEVARSGGVCRFTASVLPENQKVLTLFQSAFRVDQRLQDGTVAVSFPIA